MRINTFPVFSYQSSHIVFHIFSGLLVALDVERVGKRVPTRVRDSAPGDGIDGGAELGGSSKF